MILFVHLDEQASREHHRLLPFALGTFVAIVLLMVYAGYFSVPSGWAGTLFDLLFLTSLLGMVVTLILHFVILLKFAIRKISKLIQR